MVKRLLAGVIGSAICGYVWNGSMALWFGRFDPEVWQAEHPAAAAPVREPGPYSITVVESRKVVPSEGLGSVPIQSANNNLHVVRHSDGRVYLAWRTAPTHFASESARIMVASSEDEVHWRHEATFATGTDLREPQLLSLKDKLFLYVSKLGNWSFDFRPAGVQFSQKPQGGGWSHLEPLELPAHIAWSVKPFAGKVMMSAYSGGENLYAIFPSPLKVRFLSSEDGQHWRPFSKGVDPFYVGGASEADFIETHKGGFLTVMRNEGGDASGFGSVVCNRETPSAPLSCVADTRKFDSPRLFRFQDQIYLLARRHVTKSGDFDQNKGILSAGPLRRPVNQALYIVERKRCAVWRYRESERRFAFELDLPSRGDTCFAAILDSDEPREFIVYDYSSDVEGPDVPWTVGQRNPTYIYRHRLRFE